MRSAVAMATAGGVCILGVVNCSRMSSVLRVGVVAVAAGFRIGTAVLAEECHEPQPEHVKGRHPRSNHADRPKYVLATAVRRPENAVLRKEAGKWRDSRN